MKIFGFMTFHIKLWIEQNLWVLDSTIRIYDGTRYLILFGSEKYDAIYNRIRCLISLKRTIPYIFFHYFAKIKINSYDSLPLEKRLTLNNVIILIKSVLNKDKNY